MSLICTDNAIIINLSRQTWTGKFSKTQALIYIAGYEPDVPKYGQTVKGIEGLTPQEAFVRRYEGSKSLMFKDGYQWTAFAFVIIDRDIDGREWYDNDHRKYFWKKCREGRIGFSAIWSRTRTGDDNAEALLEFKLDQDLDTLISVLKSYYHYEETFNTKEDWTPREYQPGAIGQTVASLFGPSPATLLAAYPSFGKTSCAIKIAHLYRPQGGIVLVTTPIVDTIQGFEDNLERWRFGAPDLKVSCYTRDTILDQDPRDLKRRSDCGELIFILLSVQGMRRDSEYFDRDGISVDEEAKYYKFVKNIDLWIADEYHREYGGEKTSAFFATVKAGKILSLTGTPLGVLDQFDREDAIIQTLAWGLANRKITGLPEINIQSLDQAFYNLRPEMQDLFSQSEGWDPRKWFDRDGDVFVHAQAMLELSQRQYFLPVSKNKNHLSIANDLKYCSSSQVGITIIPEGSNGYSAPDNAELYCKLHNDHFANKGTLWISAYEIDRARKSMSVNEYVTELLEVNSRVIIVTHRKFTTGTDIPALGFIVLLDKIGSIVEFEQVLGRLIRNYDGKDRVCLYAFCPGNDIKANLVRQASASAKMYGADPVAYLDCLPLTEYDGSDLVVTDPEEMLEQFWETQRDGLRLRLPTQAIDGFFRSNADLVKLWQELNEKFKAGDGFSYGLGEGNDAEVKKSKAKSKKAKKPALRVNNIRDFIETIKTMWTEVPAFALLLGHNDVRRAFECRPMRLMFSDQVIDTMLASFDFVPDLRRRLQQELDRYLDSCRTLSAEDQYRYVFKNSKYKMSKGLVYLPMAVARRQVSSVSYGNVEYVFVFNALNGTYVLAAQEKWPNAKIICFELWPYYAEHLRNLGATVITGEQELDNLVKELNMQSRPLLLTNPPYTDGSQAANEIYTSIIDRAITRLDPIAIGGVTPENLINGGQKKAALRRKLKVKYGFKSVSFLNQDRDWKGDISVDTISWVVEENYTGQTEIQGRFLGETYHLNMHAFDELINGETQDIHDWIINSQTANKIKLNNSADKKTGRSGPQIKISKEQADRYELESGEEYDSHNSEWRLAFGYMRANTCAIVPPGPSIPGKYRYMRFGQNELLARKWADYMLSEPIRFIMMLTYTSRTLDQTQISYVPELDFSQFAEITNEVLYKHWNVSRESQIKIRDLVGGKVPF